MTNIISLYTMFSAGPCNKPQEEAGKNLARRDSGAVWTRLCFLFTMAHLLHGAIIFCTQDIFLNVLIRGSNTMIRKSWRCPRVKSWQIRWVQRANPYLVSFRRLLFFVSFSDLSYPPSLYSCAKVKEVIDTVKRVNIMKKCERSSDMLSDRWHLSSWISSIA